MLEGIRFLLPGLHAAARRHLNFMAGREVRIRVLRGGLPGETARLRLGEIILEARISGEAIRSGTDFYARIVKVGEGSYELEVRGGKRSASSEAGISGLKIFPREVRIGYFNFLAKMGFPAAGRQTGRTSRRGENRSSRSPDGGRNRAPEDLRLTVGKIPIDSSFSIPLLFAEFLLELHKKERRVENWFIREWLDEESSPDQEEQHPEPVDPRSRLVAKPPVENFLLGYESSSSTGYGYYLLISLSRLGRVGLLLSSPHSDFIPLDILLTPESKYLEKILLENRAALQAGLEADRTVIGSLLISRSLSDRSTDSMENIDYRV